MKHHLLTAALLLAALVLYGVGISGGGSLLLAAGATCELWFWVRVIRRAASPSSHLRRQSH